MEYVNGAAPENVYIFRNQSGIRVKQFGRTQKNVKLLSVKKSKKVAISHTHFSNHIGASYGFSGIQTRVYPYYMIGCSDEESNKLGLIDSMGNVVLEQAYDEIIANYNGSIILTRKGVTREIRNRELSVQYTTTEFELSLSRNQQEVSFTDPTTRLSGLMDKHGNILIPCKYQIIWSFNEHGLAKVRNAQHREGYVDSTGNEIIEVKYQSVEHFSEGLVNARIDDKRGFLNANGEVVIPFIYTHAFWFVEGLTRVSKKIDGVYYFGYIDNEGNEVIPFKYANATDFHNGIAEVRIDFEHDGYAVRAAITSPNEHPKRPGVWIKIDREGNKVM